MEEPYFWFKWQELFKNKTMKTWIITKDGDLWVINSKYCTSRWWYKLFYDAWKIVSDNLFIWSPSASKHRRESLILLFPSHLPIEYKLFDSLRHILRMQTLVLIFKNFAVFVVVVELQFAWRVKLREEGRRKGSWITGEPH